MKEYKVEATISLRSVGYYVAENEEEAIEKFRLDEIKLDYNSTGLGYSMTGWNPVATEVTSANV
jgi:hypothetical protein